MKKKKKKKKIKKWIIYYLYKFEMYIIFINTKHKQTKWKNELRFLILALNIKI